MNILKIKDPQGNWVDIPALKGDKGDKGDPGISPTIDSTLSQANQAADAKAVGDKINEITLTVDETLTQSGQVADAKVTGDALNTKADQNGYYENLNVGVADQLASKNYIEDNEAYTFRPTANGAKVGTREFDTIVGGSIVWNQLATKFVSRPETIGITITADNTNGSIHVAGTATSTNNLYFTYANNTIIGTHVYLIIGSKSSNHGLQCSANGVIRDYGSGAIFKRDLTANNLQFQYYFTEGDVINETLYPQWFDLTQMFGYEIADYIYSLEQATAGAGIAWFRKYFPENYYEYNAGELMHVTNLQSHDTVEFNLFDKRSITDNSYVNPSGVQSGQNEFFVSDFIPCIPNTVYYSNTDVDNRIYTHYFYDKDMQYIGRNPVSKTTFTTPSGAYYMRVNSIKSKSTVDRLCINLSWFGTRDGEYEPYVKHSYPLDPSLTLRGIPKLIDEKLAFDGDIYKPDGTVERRYGIVDLGTLNWVYRNSGYNVKPFLANLSDTVVPSASTIVIPAFCGKYPQVVPNKLNVNGADKIFGIGIYFSNQHNINIVDTDYTDATAFKNAMSGVYLIYPLATPTIETAQPYQSPQIIDSYGTEEYVTTSIVPVGHQTQYPEDLRAKIESLPWDFANLIAPVEITYIATRNYTADSLFIIDNILYKATANIANGGAITPNTNCTATTLAEIIAAL